MKRRAVMVLMAAAVVASCDHGHGSSAVADTVAMPPVDGSIPLTSPGSVPAQTIPASPVDRSLEGDTGGLRPGADTQWGAASRSPRDTTDRDTLTERDSAITGPFIPVPVPPDTG
jgi:hypothetical protein